MTASTFALILGLAYAGAGVLGMIPQLLLPPPADAPATSFNVLYGYLLGLFPVNLLHSGLHLLIGLWGLAAWSGAANPAFYARALAVVYGVLAVMGLIPALHTVFGLIPIHGNDVWLHALTAVAAAYFGFRSPALEPHRRRERRYNVADRRYASLPVADERRSRAFERRQSYGHGQHTLAAD